MYAIQPFFGLGVQLSRGNSRFYKPAFLREIWLLGLPLWLFQEFPIRGDDLFFTLCHFRNVWCRSLSLPHIKKAQTSGSEPCLLMYMSILQATSIPRPHEARAALKEQLGKRKAFLVCDENTSRLCLPRFPELQSLPRYVLQPGESRKTMEQVLEFCGSMQMLGHPRSGLIVSLGGGVVSDMAGFAASIYKRGLDVLHIPTTLMGMVDAATGGKTGVNFDYVRNALGTTHFPVQVLLFPDLLETLERDDLLSGMAEMHKHAFLAGAPHWERALNMHFDDFLKPELIHWHAQFKQALVERDPFDKGLRQQLNLGHTTAHAVESLLLKHQVEIPHGFAVAAGIDFEMRLALELNTGISEDEVKRTSQRMRDFFPPLPHALLQANAIVHFMQNDKKNRRGITFTLAKAPGEILTGVEVDEAIILKHLQLFLHARNA